ncbi:hypothetical protein [Paenibacillus lutrae]|uniref:Uncharacterized protein n=1 Tax=Paenibacillus lutrae TaxID=2078573 RepID=A0A7X3FFX9_9BACL|nr:hypothetical protein [Paenibacillus lutrae]MVO98947.1 hypothetical protein [Paenibacillus lutrae]
MTEIRREEEKETFCPWCQTEIVWDPEIGPEESCPHCYNELGNYRSLTLGSELNEEDDEDEDEKPPVADSGEDLLWEEDAGYTDAYAEAVMSCLDTQEEAPECSSCRELMLHAGTQSPGADYKAAIPAALGKPFLDDGYKLNVYVCPSCFKVETFLDDAARERMLAAFGVEKDPQA